MRETASMASHLSRRQTLQRGSLAAVMPVLVPAVSLVPTPALASTKTDAEKVLEALTPLTGYVDDGKWDAVRTVLAQSPIVELWKTGSSKNWIRAAALSAGDPELIELSEDLSSALQLTDQCEAASGKKRRRGAIAATRAPGRYVYDNNFIYFQPGNGKARRSVDGVELHAIDARILRSHAGQDEGAQRPGRCCKKQAQSNYRQPLV